MSSIESTYRAPDWRPLQRALEAEFGRGATEATLAFWFIGFVEGPDDIGELRMYEHSGTRGRIALDVVGNAYQWCGDAGRYCRDAVSNALVHALV